MAELSRLQQAVAYQALYGALGPVVKAGGEGLRGEVDRELREVYEQTGAKTYRVTANGIDMGTYTVVENRPEPEVPEHEETRFALAGRDELMSWLGGEDARDLLVAFCDEEGLLVEFAKWCIATTGELPDGVTASVVTVPGRPAKPASYKGGMIRVDRAFQSEVRRRMQEGVAALVSPAGALLGDGSDG